MRSLIVYYSHSGNTARIAYKLLEALKKKGEVDIFELRSRGGRRGLLSQLLYRFAPISVKLSSAAPLDIEDYDLLCVGIPVWGGRPAPPVTAYLKGCKNIHGKKLVCFLIYGIETSARRCLEYVREILDKKGRTEIIAMNILWRNARDDEVVDERIKETIYKLS